MTSGMPETCPQGTKVYRPESRPTAPMARRLPSGTLHLDLVPPADQGPVLHAEERPGRRCVCAAWRTWRGVIRRFARASASARRGAGPGAPARGAVRPAARRSGSRRHRRRPGSGGRGRPRRRRTTRRAWRGPDRRSPRPRGRPPRASCRRRLGTGPARGRPNR